MAKLISGWVSDLLSGQPGDAAGRKLASGNDGSNHYGGIMTFTWIVIAVLFVVGLFAYSARKKRNAMNDAESTQSTAQSTEQQIADAGSDSQYSAGSSVIRPLPDTQTGRPDPDLRLAPPSLSAALDSDHGTDGQPPGQLLETREIEPILGQWKDIQAEFVDEPRKAVQDADALVAEVMQRLAQTFATEREHLEAQWSSGDDVSTEDLRRSLRRYRSFVEQPYAQLVETDEMQPILGQWKDIQAEFVDEPRKAVQDADALVAELLERLAQTFATEREHLEAQSVDGDDVSTEDLRRSLRRYRSFFERLLAA